LEPDTGDIETLKTAMTEGLANTATTRYYSRCKRPDSPPMRDSNPTVILIPGLGMIAWGRIRRVSGDR
jgi:rhamnose utilization protein RhaD (predicted bifunctional aldolase and dehydrogenase)